MSFKESYIDILMSEFEARCNANPSYSLRAYARDLDLTPSNMSEILNNRKGISRRAAYKIAKNLNFNENEISYFCSLVQAEHARSPRLRNAAKENLKIISNKKYHVLSVDEFKVIANWYHYAILELSYLEDCKNDATWIAKKLDISKIEAQAAITRLKKLGLIEERNNKFYATENMTSSPNGVPSKYLKEFHTQLLDKAKKAIYLQKIENRDITSMTMSIDKKDVVKAKELLKDFRRRFAKLMTKNADKNSVYNLSLSFFRLDQDLEE